METPVFLFSLLLLFPFAAGVICYILGRWRGLAGAYALLTAPIEFAAMLFLGSVLYKNGARLSVPGLLGVGLNFSMTGLQYLLCMLCCLLWLGSTLASREQLMPYGHVDRYQLFSFITWGAIIGVFLAADLFTLLVFFEVMSFASWPLVQHSGTAEARRAADSYLAYAVIGGLCTLMGLFLLYRMAGPVLLGEANAALNAYRGTGALYAAGVLAAVGFASKAAVWPLHTWLPAAHPVAPAPASALLSGIITKAGMYGLLFLSSQMFLHDASWAMGVFCLGLVTMLTGAVLAVFSIDLKRTLACSSMSQIGFILVGLGMQGFLGEEDGIAVSGLTLHITNHAIFKLCLFLSAGVVATRLHHLKLEEIKGFGRGKPLLMFAFSMGAVGLMGVPLFSGYVSKTLLHESIVEYLHLIGHENPLHGFFAVSEWLFLIAGGLTAAYMCKLFFCLFVEKNADPVRQAEFDAMNGNYMSRLTGGVLLCAGLAVPVLGCTAPYTMDRLGAMANGFFGSEGLAHSVHYFTLANLKGSAVSLTIGAVVYLALVRPLLRRNGTYVNLWPAWLDLEARLYRPLLSGLAFWAAFAARTVGSLFGWFAKGCNAVLMWGQGETVRFPEDEFFGAYEANPAGRFGFRNSTAFGLLLFCIGFGVIMFYLLWV